MIDQPFFIVLILIALTGGLWKLDVHPIGGKLFKIFPMPFWCYVTPMALTTFGWLPETSSVYSFFSRQILPVAIVLLLLGTDLKALRNMGPLAAIVMLAGSFGTILGGLAGFSIFKQRLPAGTWASVGALAGSWIGGSMNMLAVKEALQIPDAAIGPVIITDALIAYGWMAFLISGSNAQNYWNKIIRRSDSYSGGNIRGGGSSVLPTKSKRLVWIASVILGSAGVSLLAQWMAGQLPAAGHILNPAAWTILMVTTAALVLSLFPISKIENARISRIGTFTLCLLLTSIGARANFRAVTQAPIFLAFGLTWILIHGGSLLFAGYLLKAPLKFIATASQANIGGVISAPIVGATYHHEMAGIGLLMAILGNVLGTYLGLLTAALAHHL